MSTLKQYINEEGKVAEELMVKFLKGATGILTPKNLELMFSKLQGWKIEKSILVSIGEISNKEADRIGINYKNEVYHSNPSNSKNIVNVYGEHPDSVAGVLDNMKPISKLPDKLKGDTYYYLNPTKIERFKYPNRIEFQFSVEPYYAARGYVITGPNGLRCELKTKPGYIGPSFSDIYMWSRTDGKQLLDAMKAIVGDPTLKKKPPIIEGETGECQICEHVQKLNRGKLVLHGFTRPGDGYVIGKCYGVYHLPYSESCDQCKEYLKILENERDREEKKKKKLQSKNLTSLMIVKNRITSTITPIDPMWKRELEYAIHRVDSMISAIQLEIIRMTKRIKDWKKP